MARCNEPSGTDGGCMGPGYLLSSGEAEGEQVYQYFGAWPHSHGNTDPQGRNDTAIVRHVSRRDGWVSADGDYAGLSGFGNDTTRQPSVTTVPLPVPCCGDSSAAQLWLNMKTSVVGFIAVELRCAGGTVCQGYTLERASRIRGNFIARPAGWGDPGVPGDFTNGLKVLEGEAVSVHLVLPDAEVYSVSLVCD